MPLGLPGAKRPYATESNDAAVVALAPPIDAAVRVALVSLFDAGPDSRRLGEPKRVR